MNPDLSDSKIQVLFPGEAIFCLSYNCILYLAIISSGSSLLPILKEEFYFYREGNVGLRTQCLGFQPAMPGGRGGSRGDGWGNIQVVQILDIQSMHLGPATAASPGSLLKYRVSGPTANLSNHSLHFSTKSPGDLFACKSLRSSGQNYCDSKAAEWLAYYVKAMILDNDSNKLLSQFIEYLLYTR